MAHTLRCKGRRDLSRAFEDESVVPVGVVRMTSAEALVHE
jgi:hypothetical protein